MVAHVDLLVGRVVDALRDAGRLEDTLVLFTADNGSPDDVAAELGGRERRGAKGKLNDAGTHVPLLALWPGTVPAGRTTDALVDFSDFFPTLLELAGVAIPDEPRADRIDGVSFAPVLRGESDGERSWVYCQVAEGWYLRDHHWRVDHKGRARRVTDDPLVAGRGEGDPAEQRERLLGIYKRLRFE